MTPGTHPNSHSRKVINTGPQPLSKTAKGGQRMQIKTRIRLIFAIGTRIHVSRLRGS